MLRKLTCMLGLAVLLSTAPVLSSNAECNTGVKRSVNKTSSTVKHSLKRTGSALKTGFNKTKGTVKTNYKKTKNRILNDDKSRDKMERM